MKILANDGISAAGVLKLQEKGFEVLLDKVEQGDLIEAINTQGIVGLLVRSATEVRKDIIDACPGLKLIGRGGVGMDNIDVEYARSKGIHVINTPGASSQSVGELVIGHMFSLARGLHDSNRQMPMTGHHEFKSLKKKYAKGIELRGKTLGIIGFGRIGRATASYALGLGMNVVASDMFKTDQPIDVQIGNHGIVKVNVPYVELDDLLATSDFISLHVPKQADGSAVIGRAEMKKMKDGVIIVNAARGGIVDESILEEFTDNGKVRAVALDVFDNEPNPDPELLKNKNISLSPHIGAATLEAQDRIGVELADQIFELLS